MEHPLAKNLEELEQAFKTHNIHRFYEIIKPRVTTKIHLSSEPAEESSLRVGQSKIGGVPCMIPEQEWPRNEPGKSLSFIAQINFGEVSGSDKSGLLPSSGHVAFFYCADQETGGYAPEHIHRFKAIYTEKGTALIKRDFPTDLGKHSVFQANAVQFESRLSMPDTTDPQIGEIIDVMTDDWGNYYDVSGISTHQMLGYPNCIQGPMELECQLVSNGLYCGNSSGYEDPRSAALEQGVRDWKLLLQVGSDGDMMWGDSGSLYFWIREQDLQTKSFDKVWCIFQCG